VRTGAPTNPMMPAAKSPPHAVSYKMSEAMAPEHNLVYGISSLRTGAKHCVELRQAAR
jgi:hypothetical protein